MRRCARVTKYVQWIGAEINKVLSYDATGVVDDFVSQMEEILESQRICALDVALKGTPARWWDAHKQDIKDWHVATHVLQQRFEKCQDHLTETYQGTEDPVEHLVKCEKMRNAINIMPIN